jgi:hypothetical protein
MYCKHNLCLRIYVIKVVVLQLFYSTILNELETEITDFNHTRDWLIPKLDAGGISDETFANAIGVNRSVICFYMNESCRPETQTMSRTCRFPGVPLEEGLKQYTHKKKGRPSHNLQLHANRS